MPVFTYKAYDDSGRCISGSLTADTPAIARQRLRRDSLRLAEFEEVRFAGSTGFIVPMGRRRRQEVTSEFARQLALLLRANVQLVEALDVLIRQQRRGFLVVLRDIRDRVSGGGSLCAALEVHPQWFDGIFRSAVRAGQTAGQLELALEDLAVFVQERQMLQTRLFNALAYPSILAVLGTAVVLFLMSYVVPQLLMILDASDRSPPAATAVLKTMSDFLLAHWILLIGAFAATSVGMVLFYRWRPGRHRCHGLILRVPVLGSLVAKTVVAHFAQMMSLLLRSGIPFLDALGLVRQDCTNLVLSEELKATQLAVQRGSDIAPTLENSRIFPPLVTHIINVGQESGELTQMLAKLSEGYAAEVRLAIGKFTAILEPLLIVVMSVIIGFIVFATMMPILEVTRSLQ